MIGVCAVFRCIYPPDVWLETPHGPGPSFPTSAGPISPSPAIAHPRSDLWGCRRGFGEAEGVTKSKTEAEGRKPRRAFPNHTGVWPSGPGAPSSAGRAGTAGFAAVARHSVRGPSDATAVAIAISRPVSSPDARHGVQQRAVRSSKSEFAANMLLSPRRTTAAQPRTPTAATVTNSFGCEPKPGWPCACE